MRAYVFSLCKMSTSLAAVLSAPSSKGLYNYLLSFTVCSNCAIRLQKLSKLLQSRANSRSSNTQLPKMENISRVWLGPLPADSPYVKPFRLYYVQNGVEKNWDLLKVHDSVAIIIYNTTRQKLVFVKQFRPAVFHGITSSGSPFENVDLQKFPPKLGVTVELCAGIVDKELSWIEIAREEALEECGYEVPVSRIEEVMTYRSGVGHSSAMQKMYYCEVTDSDKVTSGGGVDDELIEVVECSLEEAKAMISQGASINSPPSCLMGVMWFFLNKAPKSNL